MARALDSDICARSTRATLSIDSGGCVSTPGLISQIMGRVASKVQDIWARDALDEVGLRREQVVRIV